MLVNCLKNKLVRRKMKPKVVWPSFDDVLEPYYGIDCCHSCWLNAIWLDSLLMNVYNLVL